MRGQKPVCLRILLNSTFLSAKALTAKLAFNPLDFLAAALLGFD